MTDASLIGTTRQTIHVAAYHNNRAPIGALPTTMPVGRTGQFTMQSGDSGVKSVEGWQSNATFTSGTIGLVLRRLVAFVPLMGGHSVTQYDALALALPRVYDNACLETLIFAGSGSQYQHPFNLVLVNG